MEATERRVLTAALVLVALLLTAVATSGPVGAVAACLVAVLIVALAALGRERVAIVALAACFATAPMYRGLGGIANVATPTDLLMLLAMFLLIPEVISRQARLPGVYVASLAVLAGIGLIASATNPSAVGSVVFLAQWLLCLGLLPAVLVMWQPSGRVVDGLLASYLAGQMVSLLFAFARGAAINGRYQGLSHHPNDFGLAGATCIAIIVFLIPRHTSAGARVILAGLAFASLVSLIISGSRGATVATAAVVVLIPLVERSSVWTFLGVAGGALGLAMLPYLLEIGGQGGSLARLAGDPTAAVSDSVRETALVEGWHRFLGSPFIGTGLDIVVGTYHNMFLTVAAAVGVFGLAAFLVACYVLIRPLISTHPLRRLSYLPLVFLVAGITFPGLLDRTIVVPMALAILAAVELTAPAAEPPTQIPDRRPVAVPERRPWSVR
ncbi:hypothetical protein ACVW00_003475 [Marmoricola sp. URHA0025 HA25]